MKNERGAIMLAVAMVAAIVIIMFSIHVSFGRDLGQWENSDPAVREWFKTLMRPDFKDMPCCGEADGYWCDDIHVTDGRTTCTITDDRPNGPLKRQPVPIGTVIEIPPEKLKWDRGNPTGHSIVFLGGGAYGRWVYCFVQNGGV